MKLVITKTTILMINGDTKVNYNKTITQDLEATRMQVLKSNLNCKSVRFTYYEQTD